MKTLRKTLFAIAVIIFTAQAHAVMYLARPYDPNMGRWMSRDPIGENGGENLYSFVLNKPVFLIDPLGFRPRSAGETAMVVELIKTYQEAENKGDDEYTHALGVVIDSYTNFIESLPEQPPLDQYFIRTSDELRIDVATSALSFWANPHKSKNYLQSAGPKQWEGLSKCNKYVADVLLDASVLVPYSMTWSMNSWPPNAGTWADPRDLTQFKVVWRIKDANPQWNHKKTTELIYTETSGEGLRYPKIGDIVAFGNPGAGNFQAHVGIYLGGGFYISATGWKFSRGGVAIKGVKTQGHTLYRSPDSNK